MAISCPRAYRWVGDLATDLEWASMEMSVILHRILQQPDTIVLQKIAAFITDSWAICGLIHVKLGAEEA